MPLGGFLPVTQSERERQREAETDRRRKGERERLCGPVSVPWRSGSYHVMDGRRRRSRRKWKRRRRRPTEGCDFRDGERKRAAGASV